ncbi:MAG: universal stress protein, partial [Sporomusaceae bacterium]|nr:universal stress protein [Sporomusaceae bacterium]
MSIKKMVVAYDGSTGSQKALVWAVDLALKLKSDVVVVTVVKPPEFSSSVDEVDEVYTYGEKHCRPLLEKAAAYGEEQGILLQTEILFGHPAESLVRYAADRKADLIVMGTRGMGGFKNLVIG